MGGQPTHARYRLESCEACFDHNQRAFKDKQATEKRYCDEMRMIGGIKNRYSPK